MKVMLLHAWPPDETMWERQAIALQRSGFEPYAPRLYGRGASIDGWAVRLLDELDGPFVAVGASMGGYCALALARRAPERVVGMVLAGSKAAADDMRRRVFRNELIARLREKGVPDDLDTHVDAKDLAVAQEAMRDRLDLSGVVASFGGPLLVCVGDADELVSVEESLALADAALRGSLEIFERTGHLLTIEQPARFNDVLLAFLEEVEDVDIDLSELRSRLSEQDLFILDVRTVPEFEGAAGAPCDPRQGHIEGASNLPLDRLLECRSADEVRALVGLPEGSEIVAYCHVGSRSAFAVQVLREVGYEGRNYAGSWHEWSREVAAGGES